MISASMARQLSRDGNVVSILEACEKAVMDAVCEERFSCEVLVDHEFADSDTVKRAKILLENKFGYRTNSDPEFVSQEVQLNPTPDKDGLVHAIMVTKTMEYEVIKLNWACVE